MNETETDAGSGGFEDAIESLEVRFLAELRAGKSPDRQAYAAELPAAAGEVERRLRLVEMFHGVRPLQAGAAGAEQNPLPERIGKFAVESLLGRGGFGAVYKAFDPELGRTVAIKVPRAGSFASAEEEERFLGEARSAAFLRHPGIVQIHEIACDRGVPFIVCEYIAGRTLADWIKDGRPGYREGAQITAQIADALDHAHRQGVVHRDVKPGNVLIDSSGRPHIADFGLARRVEADATLTLEGQILGTPAYMSPEQATGNRALVDARSDVYSLGVVLYEVLTGERPFRGERSSVIHQVLYEEPRPPRALDAQVPRDLETISLKAMAKERGQRYATARSLADDLLRFLNGEPIAARPASVPERLWRWARRQPAVASLTAAVALLLVAGTVVSVLQNLRTSRANAEATRRLSRLYVATGTRAVADGDLTSALAWFVEAERLDRDDPERSAMHDRRFASILHSCPRLARLWSFPEDILQVEVSPGGRWVAFRPAGTAGPWLADVEEDVEATRLEHPGGVFHLSFSPDSTLLVTAGLDGTARLWSPARRELALPPIGHPKQLTHAAFSPDGKRLVTACFDGQVRSWDLRNGEPAGPAIKHDLPAIFIAFSPDGGRIVTLGFRNAARVWDCATGQAVFPPLEHDNTLLHAAFSPDGRRLATASSDRTVKVWEARTGKLLALLGGYERARLPAVCPRPRRPEGGLQPRWPPLRHGQLRWDCLGARGRDRRARLSPPLFARRHERRGLRSRWPAPVHDGV